MAREEGIFCEPAGAVALAGALRARRGGEIDPDSVVVCLITGSTGIGAATARLAAEAGARVFIVSRTEEHCQVLAAEIAGGGGSCAFYAADLTVGAAVEEAVRHCVTEFGRIDALFNVAGISGRRFGDGPVHECTEEGWDTTLDTNAKSGVTPTCVSTCSA